MKRLSLVLSLLFLSAGISMYAGEHAATPDQNTAETALAKLREGNRHHVAHRLQHPDQSEARLHELEEGQHPFAVILGCADSRVPPEILFDQGLGDLFVVRVAGAVPDDEVIGSIEYAAEHLHTPLVVVLGHEKCGAVTAATGPVEKNHTASFVNDLKPAIEIARKQNGDLVHNAMCVSIDRIVADLKLSEPVLAHLVVEGKLTIVGAHYDLHTGEVIWHTAPPDPPLTPSSESEE